MTIKTSEKNQATSNLHQESSASTMKGSINQRMLPTLAPTKTNHRDQKSQKIAKGEKDFATQVKALLKREGDNNEHASSHRVEPTKEMHSRRKTTTKQKMTFATTKNFLDYVTRPTGATSRLSIPTVMPPKGSRHHRSKFRATKSTVPSLPTQVRDLEVSSCATGPVEHNQTLRGGLSSGLFHEVGKVNDIQGCSQHCCSSPICDLAFMILSHCFLVTCSSSNRRMCDSTPALATNFNPMISRVSRSGNEGNEDQSSVTASDGNSKPLPTLTPLASPLKLPLPEPEMEAHPTSSPSFTIQSPAEARESDSTSVSPSEMPPTPSGCISSLTEHNVTLRGGLHAGKFTDAVYDEVTLRKGYRAGNFTSHGKVNSTDQCVDLCCGQLGCDLMFMFLNNCFTVSCHSGYACEIVPARHSRFKPKVVYFIKNNSTTVIKPSEFNSSLSDPESFVGKQPVNAVHYKELRSNKTIRDSYKKDFTQMSNDTETVDERVKKKHTLKHESHGMISHKESRTDEKIDLMLNKLTNVTEENKRLEGEIHVLMAKPSKRGHNKKRVSSGSAGGERKKKKSKKNIKGRRIVHKPKRIKSQLGVSGYGSGMHSSARKRVVIVDTDRPPVFPPTDEHNIEEHSIHAFQRKRYQKDHHLSEDGKKTPKQRHTKKLRKNPRAKSKHWDPTNEHAIEEHAIHNPTNASGHSNTSKKNPHAGLEEGSEIKYGQPEIDTDDLELGEILKLKPNTKTAKEPEEPQEPVWINSRNKTKITWKVFINKLLQLTVHISSWITEEIGNIPAMMNSTLTTKTKKRHQKNMCGLVQEIEAKMIWKVFMNK
ncbi:hypothetical protein OS493_034628 [Desmophyllum pertusum]|uniref:MANSC domain-containing protein n=1 Tax=Desmophyllum pertusum TaxID=174260 RepID=A0A9X0D0B0_9CNID|nr:hypothetical protein OS493_034628 [Desmophyllum pertusum]